MNLDVLLSIVENPTRRKILKFLVKEPHYSLQLSKELGISQQAIMKNLSILEKNGMIIGYQESSSIGPMRTVYKPNSEFTLIIDMRNGMFLTRMIEPEKNDDTDKVEMKSLNKMRKAISDIDNKMRELNKERLRLIREREKILDTALSGLDKTECTYAHRNLVYEILDEPDRSISKLSLDLNTGIDTIENMMQEIENIFDQKERGDDNEQ